MAESDVVNVRGARNLIGTSPKGNCWGLTAFILGWRRRHHYMDMDVMEKRLSTRLRRLALKPKRFRIGDVIAQYREGALSHTAAYIGKGKWLHQTGWLEPVRLHQFSTMVRCYGGEARYYRAKGAKNG